MVVELEKIGSEKPWVARITGPDPKYGLHREFLSGIADYSRANSKRTRGVYLLFDLQDGVYEIKGGSSWSSAGKRHFIRVVDGEQVPVTMDEVLAEVAQ